MKPRATATRVLSTTRARAKMHEFRVAPEDFIELYRDPSTLFDLAVGILGDVAAVTADQFREAGGVEGFNPDVEPVSWDGEELSVSEGLRFASTFFDAYLNAKLDETISVEFSLLCAIGLQQCPVLRSADPLAVSLLPARIGLHAIRRRVPT